MSTASVEHDLLEILTLMVDAPEEVSVDAVPMRRATVFEVRAAPEDMGKLIGRRGAVARSLRTLLDCRGDFEGAQYGLEIVDD